MTVPANTQHVTPIGDWIPDGVDTIQARLPIQLELCENYDDTGCFGDKLDLSELARCFGRNDPRLQGWWGWRWMDRDGKIVWDLGAAALVNTVTGVRVPLAEVPRLLGCDVGAAGVAALVGDARPNCAPVVSLAVNPSASTHYTSNKRGPLPPGKSQDWARRNIKTIPGAQNPGKDWVVSVANYDAWLAAKDSARVRASASRRVDPSDEALADEALRDAGYRPNGGTR
jgi:hypothetical protein